MVAYRDNFPDGGRNASDGTGALEMLQKNVVNGELVVPPDCIFAMGDNRDDSPTAATGVSSRAKTSKERL